MEFSEHLTQGLASGQRAVNEDWMNKQMKERCPGWQGRSSRAQHTHGSPAPRVPSSGCSEALRGSDSQEMSGRMAFPCLSVCFTFAKRKRKGEEEGGRRNPELFLEGPVSPAPQLGTHTSKGFISGFTAGHMEVSQMSWGSS